MIAFIKSSAILLVIITPIVYLLLKLLFKNSIFHKIGIIWIITAIMASLSSEAKVLFEGYTRAMAIPVNTVILASGIYLASVIVKKPLKDMLGNLSEIANGKLNQNVNKSYLQRKDEIGLLGISINELSQNMQQMLLSIKDISDNQNDISLKLNNIAGSLSNSSSTQAASVEEISSTMQELASNVDVNSQHTSETESNTIKTINAIKEGDISNEKSIQAIKNVNEKIKMINDVAFQTNILALNAAVEASQAGDAGKGFAVVAGEVRKLAERSNMAAKEIEEVSFNVLQQVNVSGQQFRVIVEEANSTAKLVKEIASNSAEQNTNVRQVNDSIQNLNSMIQTNASEVEMINEMANTLANSTTELNGLIHYFKFD